MQVLDFEIDTKTNIKTNRSRGLKEKWWEWEREGVEDFDFKRGGDADAFLLIYDFVSTYILIFLLLLLIGKSFTVSLLGRLRITRTTILPQKNTPACDSAAQTEIEFEEKQDEG